MKNESGFSLIELLLVVVIIGLIAALAVPSLQRGIRAAENGSAFSTMRTISSEQVGFFVKQNRFGRVTEINDTLRVGTSVGDRVIRGRYTFEMNPIEPSDEELRNEYTVVATSSHPDGEIYKYELNQTGTITQILP
ncbi:MAG: prepilin-type N-terminal cleavage/methylation domain-containing protein [Blastocatellia bacterium]|nr:prepilin-type N-terminal cleavage/methylation domain-containing protein [Blastocatellia bacterium]